MARVTITPTVVRRVSPTDGVDLTQVAAHVTNFNEFTPSGADILLAQNTGASPYTVTINSVADTDGRTGDITADSIAADAVHAYAFFQVDGWKQSSGKVHCEASNAAVKFMLIRLTA